MTAVGDNTAHARALLTMMERIRAFEEQAVLAAERDKLVLGAIHPSIGQEAAAAGVMCNFKIDDIMLSTHRGHGHTLAKGADPLAMMRELLGREGGCCGRGRQNPVPAGCNGIRRCPRHRQPRTGGILMEKMTYAQAAREAVHDAMNANKSVWCVGEDLGRGGVFGQYIGLQDEFGKDRIVDTPISESAIMGGPLAPR